MPITDEELISTARDCQAAGADGIHLHVRDEAGGHLIDAERYRNLLNRLSEVVPGMYLQVTSESAGCYDAEAQRAMIRALRPRHVSVAMREMVRAPEDWAAASDFYHWAQGEGVSVQHILYSPEEVTDFIAALDAARIPGRHHLLQLVRGTYAEGSAAARPIEEYLAPLERAKAYSFDWMLCAFGDAETESLVEAVKRGGKARVGFENSLQNADGTLAPDNAARVREVHSALCALGL